MPVQGSRQTAAPHGGHSVHRQHEGHDLWETPPDVVVCDGFTGNILLKTSEALAEAVFAMVKAEIMAVS